MPVSYRVHRGATYYWKNYDITPGLETRSGAEWGFLGGYAIVGGTHYDSPGDKFDQTTNHAMLGFPGVNIKYENDWFFDLDIPGIPNADGGDRYPTAAAKVQLGPLHVGINFFTGDPGLILRNPQPGGDGFDYYERTLNGNDPDEYRAGVGYVAIGPFRFGNDSEKRRYKIQNEMVQDPNVFPRFRVLDRKKKWYFQIGGAMW